MVALNDTGEYDHYFVPTHDLLPEDFPSEHLAPDRLAHLGGLVLPVIGYTQDVTRGQEYGAVLVIATSIAEALRKGATLKGKFQAAFWDGIAYERSRLNPNYDPAIGDVGRIVEFPRHKGSLL